jgi:hypothetical protein
MEENNDSGTTYGFKPSLFGAELKFRVTPSGLRWSVGRREGVVAYEDIQQIRMSYRPVGLLSRNYRTDIWSSHAPRLTLNSQSWKSMVERVDQFATYRAFVAALHRELIRVKAAPELVSGTAPYLYWPGVVMFAAMLAAFAALIVRALQTGAWPGAIFIVLFVALCLWQLGAYFRDNRPARYRADAMPQQVLPRD